MSGIPAQCGLTGSIDVRFDGEVAILIMRRGQNRINDSFFDGMEKALDKVESNEKAKVLITTGEGKFYSNGLDLDWLKPTLATTDYAPVFTRKWQRLILRLLTFPMPTVAALNGHAYAGGAIISLCHDFRIMRPDRGWWCLNEVRLGMIFNPFLLELTRIKLLGQTFVEAVTLGKCYTAREGFESGVLQGVARGADVLPDAIQFARKVLAQGAYNRNTLSLMKQDVYKTVLDLAASEKNKTPGIPLKSAL